MTLFIGQHQVNPPIFLAPMAGITDLPFRNVVSSFKTGHFVSEMIASQEILSGRQGVRQKAELGVDTANTSVQISGKDPYAISETAKLVEGLGAKIIDINILECNSKFSKRYKNLFNLFNFSEAIDNSSFIVCASSLLNLT